MDASEPFGPGFAQGVALQLQADREHMKAFKLAIGDLFPAQQRHLHRSIDLGAQSKRVTATAEATTAEAVAKTRREYEALQSLTVADVAQLQQVKEGGGRKG